MELDAYISLWQQRIDTEHRLTREEWDPYWDELVGLGVINPGMRPEFDYRFAGRQTATPRPGIGARRRWSLREADALDRAGRFVSEVREAFATALETCKGKIERG
jgi:hypothetical protein